ncbi:alpha/beta fold hydrolase [Sphingobacterium sp. IITKGP-BTPF85]|uniref:alpha/beta fold hydrolase n=1 Tax=Sphingobacterium sp. IITKGP-BTPF85 TaxID=1338009 RepID=UPI001E2E7921|nr:hypothetical protein [Sphingobacterium sp. IITKGP-BTPF85]
MEAHVTGYLEVNGIRLYHEIYGACEPLVLIHGGAGSIQFDFRETIIRLQERFLLIGIDLQITDAQIIGKNLKLLNRMQRILSHYWICWEYLKPLFLDLAMVLRLP